MASPARSRGPADPVDVAVRRLGDIVVDHVGDVLDVQPTGGDVGGNESLGPSIAEAAHDRLALGLAHVTVQRLGSITTALQRVGHLLGPNPRAGKDDRRGWLLEVQDTTQRVNLVAAHLVVDLTNLRDGSRFGLDRHTHWLAHEPFGEPHHLRRHRGREEGRLPIGRGLGQDGLDVFDEAHVQHLVGLIENRHANRLPG